MPIDFISNPTAFSIGQDLSAMETVKIMKEKKIGSVAVTDQGRLIGIVTERDLFFKLDSCSELSFENTKIRDIMSTTPQTIGDGNSAGDCITMFADGGFRHLPVVDGDNAPVGMVSVKDVLGLIVTQFSEEVIEVLEGSNIEGQKEGIRLVLSLPLLKAVGKDLAIEVSQNSSIKEVWQAMQGQKAYTAVLVDDKNEVTGIITERDFMVKVFGVINFDAPVLDVMIKEPKLLEADSSISVGINDMFRQGYRKVVLSSKDRGGYQTVSLVDLLQFIHQYICS